jgi:hypothetical protein
MHNVETEITINAPIERVWSLLTDFPAYPRWNPFVRSIEGRPEAGTKLKVFVQPVGSRGMRFTPTVLVVERQRELRWKGKVFMSGLFDGEHYFKLEPQPDGSVLFQQGETFTGLLVPLFKGSLDGATKQGFVAMNAALRREAESSRM